MKDQETLRAAALILTGMADSLNAIADMDDIAAPDEKPSQGLAMTEMPVHPSTEATKSNVVNINSAVEVDDHGKGIPWDHRIHTSTKKKTQKDIWKRRPGIDDEDYDAIVAELKATMAAPGPDATTESTTTAGTGAVPPPPVTTPPPPPGAEKVKTMTEKAGGSAYETFLAQGWKDDDLVAQGYMTVTDGPTPTQTTSTVPPPPVTTDAMTFPELAALVTPAIKTNIITQVEADGEAAKVGIESIALMVSRGDLVPAVYASCQQLIESRQ